MRRLLQRFAVGLVSGLLRSLRVTRFWHGPAVALGSE